MHVLQMLDRLSRPGCEHYGTLRFMYWLQWHLHRQLRDASVYAAAHRVALKGDLPIGSAAPPFGACSITHVAEKW